MLETRVSLSGKHIWSPRLPIKPCRHPCGPAAPTTSRAAVQSFAESYKLRTNATTEDEGKKKTQHGVCSGIAYSLLARVWPENTHAAPRVHVNLELIVVFSSWDKASGDTITQPVCVCVCVCSRATETTIGLAGLQKYNQFTQKYILQRGG